MKFAPLAHSNGRGQAGEPVSLRYSPYSTVVAIGSVPGASKSYLAAITQFTLGTIGFTVGGGYTTGLHL